MRKLLLLLGIFITHISCLKESTNEIPVIYPVVEIVDIDLPLALPIQMIVKDNYLIVSDFNTDNLISVFDLNEKKLVNKLLFKGRGPLEGMPPVNIIPDGDSILFHARGSMALFGISNNFIGDGDEKLTSVCNSLSGIDLCIPVCDSILICSGNFENGRYAMVNSKNGEIIEYFGEYPSFWSAESRIPDRGKGMFHQSRFVKSNDNLAVLTSHTLSFYNTFANKINLTGEKLIDNYEYDYREENGFYQAKKRENISRGASLLTSNDSNIYFVFDSSGVPKPRFDNDVIYQYDWQGNHVRIMDIDKEITCLATDADNNYLYAIVISSQTLEYSLLKIPLNTESV